ncbi:MAG: GntR family transcriptional regulator [Sphaerochaeta sp.]|nr:GntR family transcriptional regulator [Sphaerochaeta sp.]
MTLKYVTVFHDIQEKIFTGRWNYGMLLPSESELCEMYAVSRITIRRSMDELEKLGLIVRIQGKGTFVAGSNHPSGAGREQRGFSESLRLAGFSVTSAVLEKGLIHATPKIMENLRLPLKQEHKVWYFKRLRFVSNKPVVLMTAYVPKEIGDIMNTFELNDTSFYRIYNEITGKRIVETIGTLTAIIPNKEECDLLQVDEHSAHIFHESVTYLADGAPIEYSTAIYNAKAYKFTVNMTNLLPIYCLA